MELGLQGKVAIVTGASKGIGKAIALALAAEGCNVVLSARGQQELTEVVQEIQQKDGTALAVVADGTKGQDVQHLIQETITKFGAIHVLINNAGGIGSGGSLVTSTFETLSDEDWAEVFDLNVISAVRMVRAVLPSMQKQKWGRIINISSESGTQPDPTLAHYNAAKAALNNLTKSLSKAYGRDGILVNTVSPAFVKTPLANAQMEQEAKAQGISPQEIEQYYLRQYRPHIEPGRGGTPEEIASAVVFLASEQASFITGENLRVDGGSVASV